MSKAEVRIQESVVRIETKPAGGSQDVIVWQENNRLVLYMEFVREIGGDCFMLEK